ncbi:uncharacterized protein LOC127277886 isoform X2 [Leptopilina boulardi]|uniref:uncharacterized protein LOC127277886 isoform X2 n=1 Tax=Leptopilina boulardi TaxID=63433 RepID=UPI0021F6940A|nr:uncharacterized protein LOC127277886 isoform X2 [Leptopilina boulardi]
MEEKTFTKLENSELLREHQEKLFDLEKQLEIQKKKLIEAEEETCHLKEQLLDHSTFSISLGAVLGNLLWHASKIPDVVEIWISKPYIKLDEFFGAVNGTFFSFIKTYGETELPINSDECQFVMSLLGITANLSVSGKEFILTRTTGKELIKNLIDYFSYLQLATPRHALWRCKKIILCILYNISLNVIGVQLLRDFQVVNKVLRHCFKETTPEDINLHCLYILDSITSDLKDPKHLQEILASISLEKMEKIALTEDYQIITIIKKIKRNLKIAQNLLHTNKERL